ncbi:hypothetical protein [Pseudomonas chlororaphis]|uniref:hypothetical protein n=1 Tax=Pseudomonas chlororaphis TaxID=587753 RepID=UPI0013DE2734|nr:hypothetical protein [Pseudomonas chlororaphis]MBP5057408.1 hypothetical protein [Pseudomonas chlororaphis]MBP5142371.1 hypothetical protein [Pseudomonas chlororaphis]QTU01684.1 hypothetical protein HUT26_21130 [Pseudomonas chlororaphis]
MKKSSVLAQQVIKAQQAMQEWPESIRSGLKLESSVSFIIRDSNEKQESASGTKNRNIR